MTGDLLQSILDNMSRGLSLYQAADALDISRVEITGLIPELEKLEPLFKVTGWKA
jgi:hypothetical protein